MKNFLFHAIILSTILGTVALGVWQLQRREWKHETIARLEKSYREELKDLPPLAQVSGNELDYTHKMIILADCQGSSFSLQPGKFLNDKAGNYLFCNATTFDHSHLLILVGWVAQDFDLKKAEEEIDVGFSFSGPALFMPFSPAPWWLPSATRKRQIMWPARPASPSYPVYAILDDDNGRPMPTTPKNVKGFHGTVITIGKKPELSDDHLQYALTWFTLAAVLSGYYIYYQWKNRPIKIL